MAPQLPSPETHVLTLTARQQQNVGILAVAGRIDPTAIAA